MENPPRLSYTNTLMNHTICTHNGCITRASFGYLPEGIKSRCLLHKIKGMTNLMNGCLLCNMSLINKRLCNACSRLNPINLAEKFIIQYIKLYYKTLLDDNSFKLLISVNTNSELGYDPYKRLRLLEIDLNTYRVILIIVNFNMNPYMQGNKLIPGITCKLMNDLKSIMSMIQYIHYDMVNNVPTDTASRIFYI